MMQQLTMNDHPLTLLRSARMQDGCLHKGAIISDVQDYEPAGSHLSAEGLIGGFPCQVGNPAVLWWLQKNLTAKSSSCPGRVQGGKDARSRWQSHWPGAGNLPTHWLAPVSVPQSLLMTVREFTGFIKFLLCCSFPQWMVLKVFLFSGECGPSTEPEKPGVAALRVQGQGFNTCFVST